MGRIKQIITQRIIISKSEEITETNVSNPRKILVISRVRMRCSITLYDVLLDHVSLAWS